MRLAAFGHWPGQTGSLPARRVWPDSVLVLAPIFDDDLSLFQAVEDFTIQQPVTQLWPEMPASWRAIWAGREDISLDWPGRTGYVKAEALTAGIPTVAGHSLAHVDRLAAR